MVMNVVQVHTADGFKSGLLVTVGRKYLSIIFPDSAGIRIKRMPLSTQYRELQYRDKPYPVGRAKRLIKAMGKSFGITKSAKRILK